MTDSTDNNVKFELTASPDDTRYLVHNRLEIVRVLRGLAQRRDLVSAFFNAGNELLLTSVLEVDPDNNTLFLDFSGNQTVNNRILASEKIIFVSSLDGVKIQWVSTHIDADSFEGGDAFRVAVPDQLLRLQRREYYRLTTPIIRPLICKIPLADEQVIDVALVDISAGGIGVIISQPANTPPFEKGALFPNCKIELPGIGLVEVTLRVQSTWEITLKNGNKSLRAGCEFVDMRSGMQSMIQRYIIKLERERIANAPGH